MNNFEWNYGMSQKFGLFVEEELCMPLSTAGDRIRSWQAWTAARTLRSPTIEPFQEARPFMRWLIPNISSRVGSISSQVQSDDASVGSRMISATKRESLELLDESEQNRYTLRASHLEASCGFRFITAIHVPYTSKRRM